MRFNATHLRNVGKIDEGSYLIKFSPGGMYNMFEVRAKAQKLTASPAALLLLLPVLMLFSCYSCSPATPATHALLRLLLFSSCLLVHAVSKIELPLCMQVRNGQVEPKEGIDMSEYFVMCMCFGVEVDNVWNHKGMTVSRLQAKLQGQDKLLSI